MNTEAKVVYEGPIAGISYGHFRLRPDRIVGRDLIIVPKPDNKYDSRALAIMAMSGTTAAVHVGYIPRTRTRPLHDVLEAGGRLKCECRQMRRGVRVSYRYGQVDVEEPFIAVTTIVKIKPKPKPLNPVGGRRLILT